MLGEVQSIVDAECNGATRHLVATLVPKVLLEIRGALSGALVDWQRPAARGVCLGKIGEDIERGGTCLSCPGHAAVYGCIQHHR